MKKLGQVQAMLADVFQELDEKCSDDEDESSDEVNALALGIDKVIEYLVLLY